MTCSREPEIRWVRTIAEYHQCEELQRAAWGFDGDLDVIPLTQMMAANGSGGIVLGAFDADAILRGFCYGFLGRDDQGRLLHYSHMSAVEADSRVSGLGARLKWAQRDAALEQGLDLMVWTYDPLESLNGYFNFSKLGVLADTYLKDYYGSTSSALHRGNPTDRLRVGWHLRSARVGQRRQGERGALATNVAADPEQLPSALTAGPEDDRGLAAPQAPDLQLTARRLTCEVPASIQVLKERDPECGLAWRMATCSVFTEYLGRGYEVRECVRTREPQPRTLYVFERAPGPSARNCRPPENSREV